MRQKQIVLGRFYDALDAEIAKGYLTAAGIDASILKDDGGRMFSSMQQRQGVLLVVAETQEKKARAILTTRPNLERLR
ncbi:hypothetical protein DCC62_28315 [candidate division KSB1 bacterium]|nr:MAG: hypothetical protein DCC62_28315 [candidate division KSB1 bacterium]